MKRTLSVVLALLLIILSCPVCYGAEKSINLILDGKKVTFTTAKILVENSVTYVPLEEICSKAGISYTLNRSIYKLSNEKSGRTMEFGPGRSVKVSGVERTVPFEMIYVYKNGAVIAPLAFIIESLGGKVFYDEGTNTIVAESYSPVVFTDSNFESEIRNIINKPQGEIFKCDVCNLKALSVPAKNIENIEGIQYFTELTQANLSGNRITDITLLKHLSNLKSLLLKDNPIEDFSPTAGYYENLTEKDFQIDLNFNDPALYEAVKECFPVEKTNFTISDLKTIKKLDAQGRGIKDLKGIQNLINLKELNLSHNNLTDLKPLNELSMLQKLDLSNNSIEEIGLLEQLSNLKELYLNNNKIKNPDCLKNLTGLTALFIAQNDFTEYKPLCGIYKNLVKKDFRPHVLVGQEEYYDFVDHWAREYIVEMLEKKILSGYSGGLVKPGNHITRAEMAVLLVNSLNLRINSASDIKFTDMDSHWSAQYVKAVSDKGILNGYPDKTFKPDNSMTRAEMIAAIMKAFKFGSTSKKVHKFNDEFVTPSWALPYINKAYEMGITKGFDDNTIRPSANVTRAEVCTILSKALKLV